jgi:hypothetical protein
MVGPVKTALVAGPAMSLGGNPKVLRFSHVTYPPHSELLMGSWTFNGSITIYMVSGESLTIANVSLPTPGEHGERQRGASLGNAPGTANITHNWTEDLTSTEFTLHPGDAIAFQSGIQHDIKNPTATPAQLFVVSAIDEDQCGGTNCFLHP